MAQPGVAREPSMEEILASIRRIIESNEPGAPVSGQPESDILHEAAEEDERDFSEENHAIVADSMGTPLRAANSANPPRQERSVTEPATVEKPQSLADIAARVRGSIQQERPALRVAEREEASVMQRPAPVSAAPAFERPAAPQPRPAMPELPSRQVPTLRGSVPEFDAQSISAAGAVISSYEMPVRSAPEVYGAEEDEAVFAAPVFAEPSQEEPVLFQPESSVPHAPEMPQQQPVSEQSLAFAPVSLLSGETGAMVARSFSELAEAVDGAQRRSLDEIAEELLRPMLREWLDDNLPTMVERLVREEIERVSRGPRR